MKKDNITYSVVVPTLNAAREWHPFAQSLLLCADPQDVLILDSSSDDDTAFLARETGFRVFQIERGSFNHGGTRQLAADSLPESDVIVYLTQDAIIANPDAIWRLLEPFQNSAIGAVFGRQIARKDAGLIEAHARAFNYPAVSSVRGLEKRSELGLKTIFFSNSFGAYRRTALHDVGGFPKNVIFGEDTVTIARLLIRGWKVAYAAQAEVYHSHSYTAIQEFKRYFDIGVLHTREAWLLEHFGKATGEGRRFFSSEIAYLWSEYPALIPSALLRSALKFAGYRAGRMENKIGISLKQRLSMHRFFWTTFDQTETVQAGK